MHCVLDTVVLSCEHVCYSVAFDTIVCVSVLSVM